jgi:hypothetical protein
MLEMRRTQRRRIDEFFLGYRHQHLPASERWVIPLLDYKEQHLWSDTEAGGDIWNGRWTRELLSSLPKGRAKGIQKGHALATKTLTTKYRPTKPCARNEHRTSKWKLHKLRNILLICQ